MVSWDHSRRQLGGVAAQVIFLFKVCDWKVFPFETQDHILKKSPAVDRCTDVVTGAVVSPGFLSVSGRGCLCQRAHFPDEETETLLLHSSEALKTGSVRVSFWSPAPCGS